MYTHADSSDKHDSKNSRYCIITEQQEILDVITAAGANKCRDAATATVTISTWRPCIFVCNCQKDVTIANVVSATLSHMMNSLTNRQSEH